MEFKDFFVMALIGGLFIFCLIAFSYNISVQNDSEHNILENQFIGKVYSNVNTSLYKSANETNTTKAVFEEDTTTTPITVLGFAMKSILGAATTFISSVINMFNYIFEFGQEVFGLSPVILGTIMSIIVGLLILAGWSLIRAGR